MAVLRSPAVPDRRPQGVSGVTTRPVDAAGIAAVSFTTARGERDAGYGGRPVANCLDTLLGAVSGPEHVPMYGRESRVPGLTEAVESAKLDELPRERPWRAGLGVRPILENSTACQIIVDAKLTPRPRRRFLRSRSP